MLIYSGSYFFYLCLELDFVVLFYDWFLNWKLLLFQLKVTFCSTWKRYVQTVPEEMQKQERTETTQDS